MSLTIKCRCCNQPVKIDLQQRFQYFDKTTTPPTKLPEPLPIEPLLHITCWNTDCKLNGATFTVAAILDYETRDIVKEGKYDINR